MVAFIFQTLIDINKSRNSMAFVHACKFNSNTQIDFENMTLRCHFTVYQIIFLLTIEYAFLMIIVVKRLQSPIMIQELTGSRSFLG